ncbi:TIGR04222 domain-containing membrane protein [Nonomuraea polychroma]|uniref:TIGR04222 domain-containing membrane protein n=1 Tax=Nonomuraea polychroma TaxID=46176 RepID=UPI003D8BA20F
MSGNPSCAVRRRVSDATPCGAGHALSHYELAFLSGGPRRAINTALAVLATAGAVRVSRGSQVTPVFGAPPSPVPIEQAVLATLAARPGGYRASELRRALAAHPALAELAAGLERRGLIVPERARLRGPVDLHRDRALHRGHRARQARPQPAERRHPGGPRGPALGP